MEVSELNNKLHHKSTSRMGVLTHLCQFSPFLLLPFPRRREIIITRQDNLSDGRHLWVKFYKFWLTYSYPHYVLNYNVHSAQYNDCKSLLWFSKDSFINTAKILPSENLSGFYNHFSPHFSIKSLVFKTLGIEYVSSSKKCKF